MDYATQIQQLESLLPLIRSTRTSLPLLVSSVSPRNSSPHLDLSNLYRLASNQCEVSIKALTDRLEAIESVLDHAQQSHDKDPHGVVLKPIKDQSPWERVGDVLVGDERDATKERGPFKTTMDAPTTRDQLCEFLKLWETRHPRVQLELRKHTSTGGRGGRDVETIEMKLRGVMRVVLVVRWEQLEATKIAMVEIAGCSSLKENIPLYRSSRFSLFQDLTNQVMPLIDKTQSRSGQQTSNLEEVLTFLSNPPLPF